MIALPFLPLSKPEHSISALRSAFAGVPRLDLKQAWREKPEDKFLPGTVSLAKSAASILILSDLRDLCLSTRAAANNQRFWELGDTFEIFLRDPSRADYLELHVCPAGHRLQLRFPSAEAVAAIRRKKTDPMAHAVSEALFTYSVVPDEGGWLIFAEVPFASISPEPLDTLLVSFGRYDYGEDGPPVLSSTSAHPVLDFHRQEEWTPINLGNS
jgi:hypothetical protein